VLDHFFCVGRTFTALEARFLRASFSAFMDLLVLATRTVEQFGPASAYGKFCHCG
jgi:hypothetical protein